MRKAIYNFGMKYFISLLFTSSCIAGQVSLFQNDSLNGWHIVGPQITFALENGVLTGEWEEQKNSFLASKKSYSDFYLKVDVKIIRGNSGIQVRSHDIDNRLVGYQIATQSFELKKETSRSAYYLYLLYTVKLALSLHAMAAIKLSWSKPGSFKS